LCLFGDQRRSYVLATCFDVLIITVLRRRYRQVGFDVSVERAIAVCHLATNMTKARVGCDRKLAVISESLASARVSPTAVAENSHYTPIHAKLWSRIPNCF
jgi:hypothetical protein